MTVAATLPRRWKKPPLIKSAWLRWTLAIGVAVSSLFSNQIAVFFATLLVYLILWLVSLPSQAMGAAGGELLRYLDISEHFFNTFYQGIIDLSDVIYFLSLTALALFLGSVSVETRRWR